MPAVLLFAAVIQPPGCIAAIKPVPLLILLALCALSGWLTWRMLRLERQIAGLNAQIDLLNHRRKITTTFLHDLGEAFTKAINLDEVLEMIARFSISTTQASAGAVFLLDRDNRQLKPAVVIGPFPPLIRAPDVVESKLASRTRHLEQAVMSQNIPLADGLAGEAARSVRPILVADGLNDYRLPKYSEPSLQIRSAIFMPLRFKDEVLGVMTVVNKRAAGESEETFNDNDLFLLGALADHAAISLHNTSLYAAQVEKKQLDADLRVAGEIQQILLPDRAPDVPNFQIEGANQPALKLSGDYYDFIPLGADRLGIVILDVSGKGVPAALVTTICRSAIRAQAQQTDAPDEVLRRLNRLVAPDLREGMFITILYGVLDGSRRTFTFARAGHDPVLWHHADADTCDVISPGGVAVGLNREKVFAERIESRELAVAPGDVVALYTDGITESLDHEEKEFGRELLIEAVKTAAPGSATDISNAVFERLRRHTGDAPPQDDRTLVVIKAL